MLHSNLAAISTLNSGVTLDLVGFVFRRTYASGKMLMSLINNRQRHLNTALPPHEPFTLVKEYTDLLSIGVYEMLLENRIRQGLLVAMSVPWACRYSQLREQLYNVHILCSL